MIPHLGRHPWAETYGGAMSADGRYLGGARLGSRPRHAPYVTAGAQIARYPAGAARAAALPVRVSGNFAGIAILD